jgi:bifunctional DNA-binding transcriptional regulator/antitoxin component of YhaV-PrlF toxin-antitoxin module
VELREENNVRRGRLVEVWFDGDGKMYLRRGWKEFAEAHNLEQGYFLTFRYYDDQVFIVKIYDGTMCRRRYDSGDEVEHPQVKQEPASEEEHDTEVEPHQVKQEPGSDDK